MNPHDPTDKAFALLRDMPLEVSIENVGAMVAAFPLMLPPTGGATGSWLSNINLNSILMTTAGTLLIGSTAYLLTATEPAPAATRFDMPEPKVEIVMAPVEEVPEAVVLTSPEEARNTTPFLVAATPTSEPEPLVAIPSQAEAPMEPAPIRPVTPCVDCGRRYDLKDFSGVKVTGGLEVHVAQGPFEVHAEGDEDLLDVLLVSMDGPNILVSGGTSKNSNSQRSCGRMATVFVTMPNIERIDMTGSGGIHVEPFMNMRTIEIDMNGSGAIHFESFKGLSMLTAHLTGSGEILGEEAVVSGRTRIELSGSGDIRLAGRTAEVIVAMVGSGDVVLSAFEALKCNVQVSGSGDVYTNCTGTIDQAVMGSGEVHDEGSDRRDSRREPPPNSY